MIKKIRKYLQTKGLNISSYEMFIFIFLFVVVAGYITYLKTATKDRRLYIMTSIQRPDWWQSDSHIPRELLSSIKVGDEDKSKNLRIVEIKHFLSEQKDWEDYTTDRSIGRIQFEVKAVQTDKRLLYDDQELYIGNPLAVMVGNTRLELLITDIKDEKITGNYNSKRVLVKVYSKFVEQVKHIKKGMELKDNDGVIYAKILDTRLENSPMTTVDQWGATHIDRDPLKYDLYIDIEILTSEVGGRTVGYDGRTVGIGKAFIFSSPTLDNIGGWIMDIY